MNKKTHVDAVQSEVQLETQNPVTPEEALGILANSPTMEQIIDTIHRILIFFSENDFILETEQNNALVEVIISIISTFTEETNFNENIIAISFKCLHQILLSLRSFQSKNKSQDISEEVQELYKTFFTNIGEFLISYCEENLDNCVSFNAINLLTFMVQDSVLYDYVTNSRLIDMLISVLSQESNDEEEIVLEDSVLNCVIELFKSDIIFDELIIKFIPFFISIIPKKVDVNYPLLLKYLSLIDLISSKYVVARRQIIQSNVHTVLINFFNEIPLEGKDVKQLMSLITSILATLSMTQSDVSSAIKFEKLFLCIRSSNANVSQDSCTLLSQLIMNTPEIAQSLIQMGLIDCLLNMMNTGSTVTKQSALKIICQIAKIGDASLDQLLVEAGLLECTLNNIENESNILILNLSLQILYEIISHEKDISIDIKSLILENGGDDIVGSLVSHEDEMISNTASEILDSYLLV